MSELTATQRKREAERARTAVLLEQILAHYGRTCSCCGTTEQLGIDHKNGDGRAQRIALFGRNAVTAPLYRWIIAHGFPDDLQVMCRACNSSKGDGDHCRLYHGPALADHEKWCTGCERIRDKRTDFSPAAAARGPMGQCRECGARIQAAWRERHGTARHVSVKPGTAGGKILAYLGEHGVTPAGQLASAALGLSIEQAGSTLSGLVKTGKIRRNGHGAYCLPGQGSQEKRIRVYERGPDWAARHAGKETAGQDWAAGTIWDTEVAPPDYV